MKIFYAPSRNPQLSSPWCGIEHAFEASPAHLTRTQPSPSHARWSHRAEASIYKAIRILEVSLSLFKLPKSDLYFPLPIFSISVALLHLRRSPPSPLMFSSISVEVIEVSITWICVWIDLSIVQIVDLQWDWLNCVNWLFISFNCCSLDIFDKQLLHFSNFSV